MPLVRLSSVSRRWLSAGLCLALPCCLVGVGRWLVWDQFEHVGTAAESHAASGKSRQGNFGAALTSGGPGSDSVELTGNAGQALTAGSGAEGGDSPAVSAHTQAQLELMREAMDWVTRAQRAYATVHDYTCVFVKRERMPDGRMVGPQTLEMKVGTRPLSIYFKFRQPNEGREAIWVDGQNDGKMLVHEGGLARLLAGTMSVDPRSKIAMADNRHPITQAGIGFIIDQLADHWPDEMRPELAEVVIDRSARVGNRDCILIECTHSQYSPRFVYHKAKIYFDKELALPIRLEAFDWPRAAGVSPELLEEYTYSELRLNVGLQSHDFDTANSEYGFRRF